MPSLRSTLPSVLVLAGVVVAVAVWRSKPAAPPALAIAWPLASAGERTVALSVPNRYLGPMDGFERSPIATAPGAARDREVATLSLRAQWPDLQGRAPGDASPQATDGANQLTWVLESAARERVADVDVDQLARRRTQALQALRNMCVPTGQPAPQDVRCTTQAPQVDTQAFGLHELGRDFKAFPQVAGMGGTGDDVFQDVDATGRLKTLILCSADGVPAPASSPGPQCTQLFVSEPLNALVEVHFRKSWLPQWRDIQARSLALMASFVVQP